MARLPPEGRFASTSRGRILTLLRESGRTVADLVRALGLTENAVRHQIDLLQREGLARRIGTRPGERRPSAVFGPTPQVERFFSQPGVPLLRLALDSLAEHVPAGEREAIARDVGRRLASGADSSPRHGAAGHTTRSAEPAEEALTRAVRLLARFGGEFEVERDEAGGVVLRGRRCPFEVVAPHHREVCVMTESFLSAVLGASAVNRCVSDPPACAFAVA